MPDEVQLVVNTFERSYQAVLSPGFFGRIERDNRRPLSKVALINNVTDPDDATARAKRLTDSGEIDGFHFVADRLPDALRITGLRERDLAGAPHYTDCSLVAVTLPGPEWVLYWDADVRLREPFNWIDPSIALMRSDARIMAACPNWPADTIDREERERVGPFSLVDGFTDQVYLVRRSEFAAPIYRRRCVSRLRYPLAERSYIFEARVGAYMAHHGRLRAAHRGARYDHPHIPGRSVDLSLLERARRKRNRWIVRAIRALPVKRACWRQL